MFSMINSQLFELPEKNVGSDLKNIKVVDDLLIETTSNMSNEIAHQQTEYETLRSMKDVNGVIHYTLGTRTSRKYQS